MAKAAHEHDGPRRRPMLGGIQDAPAGRENDLETIELARFAIAEHNNKAVRQFPPDPKNLVPFSVPSFVLLKQTVLLSGLIQNAVLEFERLVKVRLQVVAGCMHYFTIEVNEGGVKKLYEAKVWEKAWENFKQLQEFKPAA
jgi:hypothetical protein